MADHEQIAALTEQPCGCTGACGKTHTSGTTRTKSPRTPVCGKLSTFTARNVAAPLDPSEPPSAGAILRPWCPDCYNGARRAGEALRADLRAANAAASYPQSELF